MTQSTTATTAPLRLNVVYQRAEYVDIVLELVALELAKQAKKKGKDHKPMGKASRLLAAALLSAIFFYKRLSMPSNDFTISKQGIRRVNRRGTVDVKWVDVTAVHRFARGYLLIKRNGGMPLPYRCFTSEQRAAMEFLLEHQTAR
ncbi:YcxB family protein [Rugamonas sp. DEMB1]|uniref:YcxB family protein n=1 Tax=Rugamonas sp. DEMB1 TaxID=3039386 RepID=UPI002446960F|nr:YcxB family protein [Rugamonas sp. DEMB1]WGG53176.1 YcxB family protein [Rugamonas sp. DEMB1]